jgi:antitoxin component YwqK of YwqJK toxin-antitoxin module
VSSEDESSLLRVATELLDFDDEQIFHYEGVPFTGIAVEDEPGIGASEVPYVSGLQEGTARDWYPSGELRKEATFLRGVAHGRVSEYRADGSLESMKVYEYGVLLQASVSDSDGNITNTFTLSEDSPNFAILQRFRGRFGS